jgi:hypothetical protein
MERKTLLRNKTESKGAGGTDQMVVFLTRMHNSLCSIPVTEKKKVQVDNKYMKKCSTYLAIGELYVETTLRFYLIPVRMAVTRKTKNNKC